MKELKTDFDSNKNDYDPLEPGAVFVAEVGRDEVHHLKTMV